MTALFNGFFPYPESFHSPPMLLSHVYLSLDMTMDTYVAVVHTTSQAAAAMGT